MLSRNEIIEQLFKSKDFNDCIEKMEPEHLRDDLRAEVMLILLETDEQKIIELDKKNELKFYTVRIVLNLMQSKTSPFYKKYRQYTLQVAENNRSLGILDFNDNDIPIKAGQKLQEHYRRVHQSNIDLEGRLQKELMEEKAIAVIDNMYWYDREIVRLYMKLGSYRAIEKDTGIPWESCYSTVRKAIKQIRSKLEQV